MQVSNIICAYLYQYFTENPDCNNSAYNSKYGVYSEGCGLDRVFMSWGHDDYMYLVLISDLVFLVTIKIIFYLLIKKIKKEGNDPVLSNCDASKIKNSDKNLIDHCR